MPYKGYCVVKVVDELENMPPVTLDTLEQCVSYVMLHKSWTKEVIIEDEDEACILHAKDGKIVFPAEYADM